MKEFTKNTVKYAIKQEIESYEFYKDAAKKVKLNNLVEIFEDLARKGLENKEILDEFLDSGGKKLDLSETEDYGVSEILDMPELTTNMKSKDAINLAIKREEKAMDMYQNLYNNALDQDIKDVLKKLVAMKREHKAQLEQIYMDTAYAEIW
ncbi:MAG TPA: ferritin family protein [Tissierellaceae bacterium]|nr:ferritin family protein [Tissierellaceae bacterium]